MARPTSRSFIFWLALPVLLLFGAMLPYAIESWTPLRAVLVAGVELFIIFALIGLYNPQRFGWAFRGVTALIFLAYLGYLVTQLAFPPNPSTLDEGRSAPSPRKAVIGFVVIGLPCLWYTLVGSFRRNKASKHQTPNEDAQA
jgi:hypothetical protein